MLEGVVIRNNSISLSPRIVSPNLLRTSTENQALAAKPGTNMQCSYFKTGIACLINRMGRKEVAIAVDGALYRFHPLFHDMLIEIIPRYLKQETKVGNSH